MRRELLWNPRLVVERLAEESLKRRRLSRLRALGASGLTVWETDNLELLDMVSGVQAVYDIGAYEGGFTRMALALFPEATVHAFEPLQRHRVVFTERLGREPRAHLHPVALSHEATTADLHVTDVSGGSSLYRPLALANSFLQIAEVERCPVRVERLDDVVAAACLPLPDLVKIDVQGKELDVLRGAAVTLQHVQWLLLELSFREFYAGQPLAGEVMAHVEGCGFRVYGLRAPTGSTPPLSQIDALFRRD